MPVYIPIPSNIIVANTFTDEEIEVRRVLGSFPGSQNYQMIQTQTFDSWIYAFNHCGTVSLVLFFFFFPRTTSEKLFQ